MGVARPRVIPGHGGHAGSDRVELDIAITSHQVALRVDQCGLESALPQCAGMPIACVEAADVATPNRLHHAGNGTRAGWRYKQVDMVGHQYEGMYGAVMLERGFA